MREKLNVPWRLFAAILLLSTFLIYIGSPRIAAAAPIVDGVVDAEYGAPIATDPVDPPQGNANLDLGDLYVTHDDTYFYIAYTINADIVATNWGKYILYIDTTNDANGATSDAWGRNVVVNDPHKPEYSINTYIDVAPGTYDTGEVQFFSWNGAGWDNVGTIAAAALSGGATSVIEYQISRADLGNPDNIWLEVYSTGGGADPAQDTVNDPADDWNATNWSDTSTLAVSTPYTTVTQPIVVDGVVDAGYGTAVATDPVDPPQGNANLDMGDLYITEDDDYLYFAYTINADIVATNWGKYILYIDTTNDANGATSDAWGRNVVVNDPHKPEYSINTYIDVPLGDYDTGEVQFFSWNGSGWDSIGAITAAALAGGAESVIEYQVSKAALGNPDTIWAEVYSTGGGPDPAQDTVNDPADDWNAVNWTDTSFLAVSTQYDLHTAPPSGDVCASGAAVDNNVWWADLGHNSRDALYRTPGGPVEAGTAVTLRFRSACDDLTEAKVRFWNDLLNAESIVNMTKVASDSQYDWWEAAVPMSAEPTIFWYRFIASDGSATVYHEDDDSRDNGWGQTYSDSPDNSWQLTLYDPAFQTPDFVKNGVMYQIFPDRFRNGDASNDPTPGRFFYGELDGTILRSDPDGGVGNPWNTPVCDPRDANDCPGTYSLNFYGGDLQGVIDQLDYLQDLGVTILYFNPIFESPSNHKYDTTDYGVISRDFGDLATFNTLVTQANTRGMSIVLDGVFNHTSSDSIYFDRYSRFDAAGNETSPVPGVNDGSGACESESSPYRDWYYFTDVAAGTGPCVGSDGTPGGATYESWFGFDSLPKLNAADPEVRDLIFDGGPNSVALYWLAEGADGWRFDVGGDVDPGLTNDPNNDYWEDFRSTVRGLNPDAYMVIEEWGNSSAWLLGNEMDATMNYQYSSAMLSFWRDTTFSDNDHNTGSSAGELTPLTPSQLDARLQNWIERYPPEAMYAMMNLLGSHDTNRALFMLDENAANGSDATPLLDPNYDWSDALTRLKGVVLLQMTLPGAPTIYYGDEVGLVGPTYYHGGKWEDDPYNRQPFPWADESGTPFYTHLQSGGTGWTDLLPYYQALTAARGSHEALRTGSFDTLLVDDAANLYAYGRFLSDNTDAAVVVVNRDGAAQAVTVDVSGTLPVGSSFTDVIGGGSYTVNASGEIELPSVPAMNGAVLVADGPMTAPPAAVTDLAATAVASDAIELTWSAAAGADSYDVYRSPVSGGGYAFVANVSGTSYSDTGLAVANNYYYVVVSRDDAALLASGYSNEATATTAYSIGWANLQWPPTIDHTISAVNRTPNIYGQIWIDGVTSQLGATPGLLAQVGFGPDGSTPDDSWTWESMTFNVDAGNNDEYMGSLLPDMVGSYDYTTRYSGDGGATWFYAVSGPGGGSPIGDLTVVAGADTTAPAAPTNLAVSGTTNGSISLVWDAHPNTAGDLHGFEVYRENVASPGFGRIDTIADPAATTYTDDSVTTGETYNYYVVAFDDSYNRSAASNTATGTAEPRLVSVTFRIGVPAYTPGTVYIVGDIPEFGPWNPGLVPMTQVDATTWEYTLDILDGTTLQYKFTRGSWDQVESWGSIVNINNRSITISYGTNGTQLVDMTDTDWGNGPDSTKAVQYWRDPLVLSTSPADGATDVAKDTAVSVTWSIPMDPATTFAVAGPGGPVAGSFAYDAGTQTVTFTPDAELAPATTYSVLVEGAVSVGVPGGDSGVQQSPYAFSFTTEANPTGYVSLDKPGTVDGVAYQDEDILVQDLVTGAWSLYFDGSDVGMKINLNAFHILEDGSILMSFYHNKNIPGVGFVRNHDIVRFVPTALGEETAGTFELYFDGSDVGLSASSERVDAIGMTPDGRLLLSTGNTAHVPGVTAQREDMIAFDAASLGANTAGTWELYFDGSDVGLDRVSEGIYGVWVDGATGDLYLTTRDAFDVPGAAGDGLDVFVCTPASLGNSTSCTFAFVWDGGDNGLARGSVDGLHLMP